MKNFVWATIGIFAAMALFIGAQVTGPRPVDAAGNNGGNGSNQDTDNGNQDGDEVDATDEVDQADGDN